MAEAPSAERDAVGGELLLGWCSLQAGLCSAAAVGTVLETDPVSVVCPPKHTTATLRAAWRKMGTSSPAAAPVPALSLGWPLLKR